MNNQRIYYCKKCQWQSIPNVGLKNQCPNCGVHGLYFFIVDKIIGRMPNTGELLCKDENGYLIIDLWGRVEHITNCEFIIVSKYFTENVTK